jgi:hypothetical protein
VICKAVGEVKVGLERFAACAGPSRKTRYLKTTTISSSAIPTCVFSFVKGEKRSHGSLICFLLGDVHSAKQAAWEQSGRFAFCHWFGPFVCESGFGRNFFVSRKDWDPYSEGESWSKAFCCYDECT